MSNADRLIELARQLPEPILSEVIDFAEYLAHKQAATTTASVAGFDAFFGRLSQSPLFDGRDGLAVQQELRNEWD